MFLSRPCKAVLGAAALLGSPDAAAVEDASTCVTANDRANELRLRGELRAAKREYLSCAAAHCPKLVAEECAALVARVEASLPTVVFVVTDESGRDLAGVRIFIDDVELVVEHVGLAVALDPGEHHVRAVASDGRRASAVLIAREGEKNRPVRLELLRSNAAKQATSLAAAQPRRGAEPLAPTLLVPSPTPASGFGAPVWVLGGVGLVGLGSFAYFGLSGISAERGLAECAPTCSSASVDRLYDKYLLADVSLGIGLVALGAATYLIVKTPSGAAVSTSRLAPTPRGVMLDTRLSF